MTTLMVEYEKQEECTLKVVSELEEQVKEKITKVCMCMCMCMYMCACDIMF